MFEQPPPGMNMLRGIFVDPDPCEMSEQAPANFKILTVRFVTDPKLREIDPTRFGAAEFLAVEIQNTSSATFRYDLILDITDAGRDALADHAVLVRDRWSTAALRATRQEAFGRAVDLPPLEVGADATVYFPIEASSARAGSADVEFVLLCADGDVERAPADCRQTQTVSIHDAGSATPTSFGPGRASLPGAVGDLDGSSADASTATASTGTSAAHSEGRSV